MSRALCLPASLRPFLSSLFPQGGRVARADMLASSAPYEYPQGVRDATVPQRGAGASALLWRGPPMCDRSSALRQYPPVWTGLWESGPSWPFLSPALLSATTAQVRCAQPPQRADCASHTSGPWVPVVLWAAPLLPRRRRALRPFDGGSSGERRRRVLAGESELRWSDASVRSACGSACTIAEGTTLLLDENMDVDSLTIRGTLRWDTSKDGK